MAERTILLVEDSCGDVELALRAFKKNNIGNEVVIKRDGASAVDYLLSCGPDDLPVVVLLDMNLPRMSGLEILRKLRSEERTRLLPVVILTSSSEERDIAAGYRLGANSYIKKPVDFAEFTEVVRQLGLYWLALNEPPQGRGRTWKKNSGC